MVAQFRSRKKKCFVDLFICGPLGWRIEFALFLLVLDISSLRNSGIPEDSIPTAGSNMYMYREKPLGRPRHFVSKD